MNSLKSITVGVLMPFVFIVAALVAAFSFPPIFALLCVEEFGVSKPEIGGKIALAALSPFFLIWIGCFLAEAKEISEDILEMLKNR